MVKIPKDSYVPLPMPDEQWRRERLNRNLYIKNRPYRLVELEEFANLAADYMGTGKTANYLNVRQTAMNQLRQLFNLEFKMVCDICGKPHYQDEISAPER